MPGEEINTTLRFNADITDFKAAMQEATRYSKLANSEFKNVASGLDDWASSSDGLRAKLNQLSTVQQAEERKLAVLKEAYEGVVREQGENSAAAVKLAADINNQQSVVNNVAKAHDKFSAELEEVEEAERRAAITGRDVSEELEDMRDAAKKAGDAAEQSAEGWTVMRGALADLVADGFRAVIDGAKDLATNIFNLGRDFTSTMSEVQAISGASGEELEMLTDTAREWGAKTVFSATEAAEAMKYMAMAGWSVEQSVDGLPGILNLAASSGTDLGTASDIVTDALTGMGYAASDAGRLADVMAAASSNANTNVEMMGGTFKYAAPIIGALGYSMEDAAVSIGLMANAGIKAEQAGTSLRAILTRLAAPPKEAATALDTLGVSITNSDGTMKEMSEVVDELRAAFANLGEAEQAEMAKKIAGQEAMSGLLAIVNAAPADYEKLTKAVEGSAGAAQRMADTMNDNLGGDIAELESALEELGLTIYDKCEQPLRSVVQWITENLNPAFNWVVDHKDIIISAVAGIAAGFVAFKTAAVITGLISGFTQFFNIIKTGQGVMTALNVVMGANPIGLVAIAIAGLVTAFTLLWQNSEEFRNFWINLWEGIKKTTSAAIDGIKKIFTSIIDFVKNNWQSLLLLITNPFAGAFKLLYDNCDAFRKYTDTFVQKVKELLTKGINSIVSFVTKTIPDTIAKITKWFGELPGKISSAIAGAIDGIVSWGKNLVEKGKDAASNLVSSVVDGVKSLPDKMLSIGSNLASGLWEGLKNSVQWLKDKISGWVGDVLGFMEKLFDINSPSGETEWQGEMLVGGYVKAIKKGREQMRKAMRGLGEAGLEALGGTPSAPDASKAAGGKTIIFNQTNNSPRALSQREIFRQTHNALAFVGGN